LRTPLQAIIGFSEQLKQQERPAPEDIDIIHRSSQHLLQIVNEVLDYSRIVSGRFVFNNQPFELSALLTEVTGIMQLQARRKGLAFIFDTDIDPPLYVTGDAFRLRQILFNLLGNAVKYTQKGSVSFQVAHSRPDENIALHFTIQDTGEGIPEADLERIFLQFEQATIHPGSTGLGLSIVRALTEGMCGTVTAANIPGSGALFTLQLSLHAAAPMQEEQHNDTQFARLPAGKVWIIDDDPFILRLCVTMLEKHNITYAAFNDPLQAAATAFPADVSHVMIDIRMPGMSGPELFALLKEKAAPGTKFIALTAQALPDERDHILDAGFDYLLMKPFMEKDFIGALTIGSDITATEQSFNDSRVIDLSTIKNMTGDDDELFRRMLKSFADETEKDLHVLADAVTEQDNAAAAECLHRIASRAGRLGNKELAAAARTAEIRLRNNDLVTTSDLQTIITSVRDFVRALQLAHS
jgi:CheY-like chemotaxis protein